MDEVTSRVMDEVTIPDGWSHHSWWMKSPVEWWMKSPFLMDEVTSRMMDEVTNHYGWSHQLNDGWSQHSWWMKSPVEWWMNAPIQSPPPIPHHGGWGQSASITHCHCQGCRNLLSLMNCISKCNIKYLCQLFISKTWNKHRITEIFNALLLDPIGSQYIRGFVTHFIYMFICLK